MPLQIALMVMLGIFLILRVAVEIKSGLRGSAAMVSVGRDDAYVDRQQIEISLSGIDLLASRVANMGLCLCGALGFLHAWVRIRGFAASKVLYAVLLVLGAVVLFVQTASPVQVLTSGYVFAKLAPGTLLAMGVSFIALDRQMWPYIRAFLFWFVVAMALWVLTQIAMLQSAARAVALVRLHAPLTVLEIGAPLCLAAFFGRKWYSVFAVLPLGVVVLGGIMIQTRLTIVMAVVGAALFFPRAVWVSRRIPWLGLGLVGAAGGVTVALLARTSLFSEIFLRFAERIDFDSRSEQILSGPFFDVFLAAFPWGIGFPAAYQYNGEGATGIDFGYLNTLLVVGLPMMVVFLLFQFWPVVKASFRSLTILDVAAWASAMCFVVRMFSSTVPALNLQFLLFCLLAGRCIAVNHVPAQVWRSSKRA